MSRKGLEHIVNDYASGKIPRMNEKVDGLLLPFNAKNLEKVKKDWELLKGYEREVQEYKGIMLDHADEKADSKLFSQAADDIVNIGKRIKMKREYVQDALEEAAVEARQELKGCLEKRGVESLREKKVALKAIKDLAHATEQEGMARLLSSVEDLYTKGIEDEIARETQEAAEKEGYTSLIGQARSVLGGSPGRKTLTFMRSRIDDALRSEGPTRGQADDLTGLLKGYDTALARSDGHARENRKLATKIGLYVAGIGIAGYLAIKGLGLAGDAIDGYRAKRAGEKATQQTEQYASELETIEQEIAQRRQELSGLETALVQKGGVTASRRQEKEKTPAAPNRSDAKYQDVVEHLAPVLGDAQWTLYVEKDANETYLIKREDSQYQIQGPFLHSDARDPGQKIREGQMRTPEGIYRIDNFTYFGPDGKSDLLGLGFWRIDYPNQEERRRGYTGSGVGICSAADQGVLDAIYSRMDVMNCGISLSEEDFETIRRSIGNGAGTQVVIEDRKDRPLQGLR
jgi:hypothetical protein